MPDRHHLYSCSKGEPQWSSSELCCLSLCSKKCRPRIHLLSLRIILRPLSNSTELSGRMGCSLIVRGMGNYRAEGPTSDGAILIMGSQAWGDCLRGKKFSAYRCAQPTLHTLTAALRLLVVTGIRELAYRRELKLPSTMNGRNSCLVSDLCTLEQGKDVPSNDPSLSQPVFMLIFKQIAV